MKEAQENFNQLLVEIFGIFVFLGASYCFIKRFFRVSDRVQVYHDKLTEKLNDCKVQLDAQEPEVRHIRDALAQCKQDVFASLNEFKCKIGITRSYQSGAVLTSGIFMSDASSLINISEHLFHLLGTYPKFPSDHELDLEHLQTFFDDNERHHAEVCSIAEAYLSETYSALNMSSSENKDQQTMSYL